MLFGKNKSITELLLMTLGLIVILVAIFSLVHSGGYILWEFIPSPKSITQNESAYIDAIGSIAIGFAGAWVAIKIALIATNLQEQDSLTKLKELHQKDADRVSALNSVLTRNALDAKRSCTSFIVFLVSNPVVMMNDEKKAIYNNGQSDSKRNSIEQLLPTFYERLEKDLLTLINSIEELIMDKTYMGIVDNKNFSHEFMQTKLASFFYATNVDQQQQISLFSDIILKDSKRFDFHEEYMNEQHNFGEGLHFLRSNLLLEKRDEYLKKLLSHVNDGAITPSHAAWLLLGSLLLGNKDINNEKLTYNTGFLFLALLLGSEIDDDLFLAYLLNNNVKEKLANEVSQTIFFIHGEDENNPDKKPAALLTDLKNIITHSNLISLLSIPGENKGNSINESESKSDDKNK
ncbi:hypothetical protein J8L70_02215 [Pseudoalteromonas sp. MMG010]|uniref:hypothetical protein n=1 Tax=Pseudoalteromonas sp. MMG010 TaxID=2822685 RepID=UPI001B3A4628|nr:hypothetical protein [Pseudoalteromonas sp. MMG010]MBQ4832047.1 hypothetical protein [Pseudoalteromonas sp. MMG010]